MLLLAWQRLSQVVEVDLQGTAVEVSPSHHTLARSPRPLTSSSVGGTAGEGEEGEWDALGELQGEFPFPGVTLRRSKYTSSGGSGLWGAGLDSLSKPYTFSCRHKLEGTNSCQEGHASTVTLP